MLENTPVWLNQNNSARKRGPKSLHSDMKDLLPVIEEAWLHFLLPTVAKAVIRFGRQLLFHIEPGRFG